MSKKRRKKRDKSNSKQSSSIIDSKLNSNEKSASIDVNKQRPTFFLDALLLLVSLLHGTLFFILAEKVLLLFEAFSIELITLLLFYYVIFFRVFQTHVLAALKYSDKWRFRPFDFVLVFMTSLFEYLLFSIDANNMNSIMYYSLMFCFCFFGAVGYLITYIRTRKRIAISFKKNELIIQLINIFCCLLVGVIHLLHYLHMYQFNNSNHRNAASAVIVLINIYLSMKLSKDSLKTSLIVD